MVMESMEPSEIGNLGWVTPPGLLDTFEDAVPGSESELLAMATGLPLEVVRRNSTELSEIERSVLTLLAPVNGYRISTREIGRRLGIRRRLVASTAIAAANKLNSLSDTRKPRPIEQHARVFSQPASEGAGSPMRIGLIAPPWVPVPPLVYGGTEMVVDLLARGLAHAGHNVTLFATGDSTSAVEDRRWVHPVSMGTTGTLMDELTHVQVAHEQLADCDVIHDHTVLGPLWAAAGRGGPPFVTTAHGEFTCELTRVYERVARSGAIVAISQHQRGTAPSIPFHATIHHGVDTKEIPVGLGDGGYVLFLGRMHPTKGVHRAIRVARAAGKKLLIAAKMWESAEFQYFENEVQPLLGADVDFLGPIGGVEKLELLANAEALLNPIRWPEPFGLVMIEALAAGTPVLTFHEGAAPEIIDDGLTGFLCEDEDEMIERLRDVHTLSRRDCRAAAQERFTMGRMVDDHIALYRSVLRGRDLRRDPEIAAARTPTQTLAMGRNRRQLSRTSALLP